MMLQGIYFFVIGAFAGWIIEVVLRIINNNLKETPGILHGPFCMLYGVATVILSLVVSNITQNFFLLFIICMVISTILEYITYVLLDKIYDIRLWDYSGLTFNFGRKISLEFSLLWGLLGASYIRFALPFLITIFNGIQGITFNISILMIVLFILMDVIFSSYKLLMRKANLATDDI